MKKPKSNLGVGKANLPKAVSVKTVVKVGKGKKMSLSGYHKKKGRV